MIPNSIRLIHLKTRAVSWHEVNSVSWDNVWTVSHVWDRRREIQIPLGGVTWKSTSFSSIDRFNILFEKAHQVVEPRGAQYIWMDAACIDQDGQDEKEEQVPFMGTIYSRSAGCVAFGTLTPDDRFAQIVSTYDNGQKAWVCDWFERVWTFQELQLPKVLLFVSGEHVLTRDEIYLSILMMSPYLESHHPSPSRPNDPTLSIQDVLNSLSPSSRTNTQRSLMQTGKRGCSVEHIHDKVYGILGVLAEPFSRLKVDYNITLTHAMLNLMLLMPPNDVLDTLTFNTLPPADGIHDDLRWSGMVTLDELTEHPSYEMDVRYTTNASVVVTGDPPRAHTIVHDAPLWRVVVAKPEGVHAETSGAHVPPWPVISAISSYVKLMDDFSRVERSVDYVGAIGRAERSLVANWKVLQPLLERGVNADGSGQRLASLLQNSPSEGKRSEGIPPNRLGDVCLFDQEVTVLVCRSKASGSFHYGIVVTPNEDGSWHKVCTASFSDGCVVASSRNHVESLVVIGK